MNYEFEIKELEPVTAAAMRYKGKDTDASKYFPVVFKAIKGKITGVPFCCFYGVDEQTETSEVEVCIPTEEVPNAGGVVVKEVPRIKALCTTHVGSYETLKNAYAALNSYLMDKGLRGGMPYREIYVKGPGAFLKGNPNNYITEIAIPLVPENE